MQSKTAGLRNSRFKKISRSTGSRHATVQYYLLDSYSVSDSPYPAASVHAGFDDGSDAKAGINFRIQVGLLGCSTRLGDVVGDVVLCGWLGTNVRYCTGR